MIRQKHIDRYEGRVLLGSIYRIRFCWLAVHFTFLLALPLFFQLFIIIIIIISFSFLYWQTTCFIQHLPPLRPHLLLLLLPPLLPFRSVIIRLSFLSSQPPFIPLCLLNEGQRVKGPSFRSIPFQFPFPFFVFINCITDTTGPTPTLSSFLLLPPPSSSFLLLLLLFLPRTLAIELDSVGPSNHRRRPTTASSADPCWLSIPVDIPSEHAHSKGRTGDQIILAYFGTPPPLPPADRENNNWNITK